MSYFAVDSGAIRASDPCYDLQTCCGKTIENVKNGVWEAAILVSDEGSWGHRVSHLTVRHEDFPSTPVHKYYTIKNLGVDSGQFGFFDLKYFQDHEKERDCDFKEDEDISGKVYAPEGASFYTKCCVATLNEQFDVIDNRGVASSSGFGDGCYPVRVYEDKNGKVIALEAVFIENPKYYED